MAGAIVRVTMAPAFRRNTGKYLPVEKKSNDVVGSDYKVIFMSS
jgi:hypothetical protein